MHTGFIKPIRLNEEEMNTFLKLVLRARPVIDKYANGKIKEFRRKYVKGMSIPKADSKVINNVFEVADILLSSVVLQLGKIAIKFVNRRLRPAFDYEDYFQEACCAANDAIWAYDGSTKFITFVYNAAKNRIISMVRKAKKTIVTVPESEDMPLEALAVAPFDPSQEEMRGVLQSMSSIERELLESCTEVGFQIRIAKKYGKTRAWASIVFRKACQKVTGVKKVAA